MQKKDNWNSDFIFVATIYCLWKAEVVTKTNYSEIKKIFTTEKYGGTKYEN